MEILGLSSSPSSGGAFALVLSEADGNLRLPIIIGAFEAQSIALELEHIRPPRPMTHDLFKSFASVFNFTVEEILISDFFFEILSTENHAAGVVVLWHSLRCVQTQEF